ncbi:MAG: hypothetical protein AB8G17_00320 [Gammaproteobacteria bacterium]
MLDPTKSNKAVFILKYLSLASLTLSVFVYLVHAFEFKVNTDYFLFLHLTSIVTFGSMIIHPSMRENKMESKRSMFDFSQVFSDFKIFMSAFKVLCQSNKFLVSAIASSVIALMAFAYYHLPSFMRHIKDLDQADGLAGFTHLA